MSTQTSSTAVVVQAVLVTADEAAGILGCHRKTFDDRVRRGAVRPAIPGRRGRGQAALFALTDIEALGKRETGWARRQQRQAHYAELEAQWAEEKRNMASPRPYTPPAVPPPPGPVSCGLPVGMAARIDAALVKAAQTRRPTKSLERLGDDWLARAERNDPVAVKTSNERHPSVRERDLFNESVTTGDRDGLREFEPRPHVKRPDVDSWRPRAGAKLTREVKAAMREHDAWIRAERAAMRDPDSGRRRDYE